MNFSCGACESKDQTIWDSKAFLGKVNVAGTMKGRVVLFEKIVSGNALFILNQATNST
jgi:hypothetical protein